MPTPKLSQPDQPVKNVTVRELRRWEELGDQARQAEAHARALRKEQGQLAGEILRFVAEKAGRTRTMERSGYRLSIVAKLKPVQWLGQFLARHGQEEVDRIKSEAGFYDSLQVEKL